MLQCPNSIILIENGVQCWWMSALLSDIGVDISKIFRKLTLRFVACTRCIAALIEAALCITHTNY